MENDEWNESPKDAINKWFDLSIEQHDEWSKIAIWLQQEIAHLINTNPEKLWHILYRIDIAENQAMEALSKPNAAEILTNLIINRQLQKAESRKRN
jgi:mevalonate kinase